MSALTKVFVVLLVVLSLLLSAGLIVWVNHSVDYQASIDKLNAEKTTLQQSLTVARGETTTARAQSQAIQVDLTNQVKTANDAAAAAQAGITAKDAEIAGYKSTIAQLTATAGTSADAVKVAQAALGDMGKNFDALRTSDDKLQKVSAEQNTRINDLVNKLDVTERERRYSTEQVTQLQQQLTQVMNVLHQYHIDPSGKPGQVGGPINNTPQVNINGVVRDTRSIGGVPYATISLGSADAVTKGMQFKVVDPQRNQFLGYLTVDTVEPHEATGRLTGPNVQDVRASVSEVRTQL
ncbi:MAG: hypothetical protein JWL69_255 [Phycisphaerales bacterium]|nr:hypothetical protein [Phycisphaerales bacterium]